MGSVLATWNVGTANYRNAKLADHFVVTLGTFPDAIEPLTATSHLFSNVDPGTYQGALTLVDATGSPVLDDNNNPIRLTGSVDVTLPLGPMPATLNFTSA